MINSWIYTKEEILKTMEKKDLDIGFWKFALNHANKEQERFLDDVWDLYCDFCDENDIGNPQ